MHRAWNVLVHNVNSRLSESSPHYDDGWNQEKDHATYADDDVPLSARENAHKKAQEERRRRESAVRADKERERFKRYGIEVPKDQSLEPHFLDSPSSAQKLTLDDIRKRMETKAAVQMQGASIHASGKQEANKLIYLDKIQPALRLVQETKKCQAHIDDYERSALLTIKKKNQSGQQQTLEREQLLMERASAMKNALADVARPGFQLSAKPVELQSLRELCQALFYHRQCLNRIVKVLRVADGAWLQTKQVHIVLWAGYGDASSTAPKKDCTWAVQRLLMPVVAKGSNERKKNTGGLADIEAQFLSFEVNPTILGCRSSGNNTNFLTIIYLGTSESAVPTRVTTGLCFHPLMPSELRAKFAGEVPMDLIEIGKRGDGTEEDKDMTNWNAMLQFVDDTQLFQVLTDYEKRLNAPPPDLTLSLTSLPDAVDVETLERIQYSLKETVISACCAGKAPRPPIKLLFVS